MTDRTLFRASAVALIAAAMASAPALAATGSPAAAAPAPTTGSMSAAPSASPQTIARAGKALHQVLEINHSYGAKLAHTTDPAGKQRLIASAKDKATTAITAQGLTVRQYDQVLAEARQNPALRARLFAAAGLPAQK
ncbi:MULTISPECIES: DUF4168 domain-containing protein [Acidiphilium]|uniref:DUF4168 domain-containing protein n=1 Tax=Acidiphilium multivorum (strain DSM 11245 / JCM 8867 / NBRC 100883 / AIU 301) TaxID=926570 RepID=F0IZD5_ACIMA|nr:MULTISPECIES: DUF4168 domain-containing protein [Acidiphilium]MDE2326491.1 DUF4168 domain-containing protein [Rhodospirillales bacterium]BAJ81145.1 hypothetical protein ACMV_17980 [Acidiphilium multivorum AIU301]